MAGLLSPGVHAQHIIGMVPPPTPLRMKQVERSQMSAANRALLVRAKKRLARAAHLFGYRMEEPGWSCTQVLTKDIPDYLMMVCRKPGSRGYGESAFSALLARRGDAVFVVPVLFGGAAPWKTASNMIASWEIFNYVVPERIAAKAMMPSGGWMRLALTFTALAGEDAAVLQAPSSKLKWVMAPEPTIVVSGGRLGRTILFSDVSPRTGVRVWTLTFNPAGKLIHADVKVRSNLSPIPVSKKTPPGTVDAASLPRMMKGAKRIPDVQH